MKTLETIMNLSLIALLPILASVIIYVVDKRTRLKNLSDKVKQILIGIVFGILAILGTHYGVPVGGVKANTRDASVLTAGLIFGPIAGIVSGLIGGIERLLVQGANYDTTRLACSISTIMAGLFGAILKKYMFDNKKPSSFYALAIGLVCEVFHMLMIFFTRMSNIELAFSIVKKCSIAMISVNGIAVMLSVMIISLLSKEKQKFKKGSKQIAIVAQQWLLNCVISAFVLTSVFTFILQFQVSNNNINDTLQLNVEDIKHDILRASDDNLEKITKDALLLYNGGDSINSIKAAMNISEINIVELVSGNPVMVDSTNANYVGKDFPKGKQTDEFLVLFEDQEIFVQDLQPIAYDNQTTMKYAGIKINENKFLQVGYDAERFQEDISLYVEKTSLNRHVGRTGFILIVDASGVVAAGDKIGKNLSELGIKIDDSVNENVRFKMNYNDEDYFSMYSEIEGYKIISFLPKDEALLSRDLAIYIMVFIEIVLFVGLFVLIYFLIKKLVVDNIKSVNSSLAKITGGNLDVTVNVRSNEEFASLSDDINATVNTLKHYIDEAAARIDRELVLAKVIQESTLPSVFPPFPDHNEFDIFASMNAAKEVGGDFYDFYLLDNTHLAFLVADVSGKGITGAMFMMKAKTLMKGFAEQNHDVAAILTKTNEALCEGNEAEMFVTCFMGVLDLETNTLEYANAGHNPPLLKRKDGKFEYFKTKAGFVLAGMEDFKYKKGVTQFNEGDCLFLYTDGVTEATNAENSLYSDARLAETLNSLKYNNAFEICECVKNGVDEFVGEAPQFDDITMLCIINKNLK